MYKLTKALAARTLSKSAPGTPSKRSYKNTNSFLREIPHEPVHLFSPVGEQHGVVVVTELVQGHVGARSDIGDEVDARVLHDAVELIDTILDVGVVRGNTKI